MSRLEPIGIDAVALTDAVDLAALQRIQDTFYTRDGIRRRDGRRHRQACNPQQWFPTGLPDDTIDR